MQSLHVLRLLLNAAAFALALSASSQRAWSVVEPVVMRWPASSSSSLSSSPPSLDSRELTTITAVQHDDPEALLRLTLAPDEYCLDARNGSSDCHAYASLLAQSHGAGFNLSAVTVGGLDSEAALLAASPSNRLRAAPSAWCMASSSSSSTSFSGSWLLQGAQSMLCLVVLETCAYSSLLWRLVGACSVVFSLCTLLQWSRLEGCASFTTVSQALLSLLVLIEWTGYSEYMVDVGYVAVLQLVIHYGASFHLTALSLVFSVLACRLSAKISDPLSAFHLAQLYALPLSPRSRRRRWSPREAGSSPLSPDSPEVENEDDTLECLEQEEDPLKCPANYRV